MIGWYDTVEDKEWLSPDEAAKAFNCSVYTIRDLAKEMEQLGLEGIWRSGRRLRLIDRKALSEYLYRRSKIKADKRLGRNR